MDAALKAAADAATADAAQIKAANEASEAARLAEFKEFEAFKAWKDNEASVKSLKAAAAVHYEAYDGAKTKGTLASYKQQYADAKAHLQREQRDFLEALCRLQPAEEVGGADAKKLTWGKRAEAIQATAEWKAWVAADAANKDLYTAAVGGGKAEHCTLPAMAGIRAEVEYLEAASITKKLAVENAKLTATAEFKSIKRTLAEKSKWYEASVAHKKYLLDRES